MNGDAFDPSCDFCRIARGLDSTPHLICSEPSWVAFFPDEPATPGHTLVIPRTHVLDFWDASPELAGDLAVAVRRIGIAITRALSPEGMNLITSAGDVAEQSVYHAHLHVLPRWRGDQIHPIWPAAAQAEVPLGDLATRIRDLC
jgi:histidine triad (HIT) family protein